MEEENPESFLSVSQCPLMEKWNKPKCCRILILKKNYMYAKTFVLVYSWICLGLYSEILGPSLLELRKRTNSNYEQISRTLTARAFGYLIGSTFGGLLHDRFRNKRSAILSVTLLIAGASIASVPWCKKISTLGFALFVGGVSHGFHTTGGNPCLAELWKDKSSGPFNLMHAGFGGGAAIAPLLVKWFSVTNLTQEIIIFNSTTTSMMVNNGFIPLLERSYLFVSGACCLCGLLFGFFAYLGNPFSHNFNEEHFLENKPPPQSVRSLLKQYLNTTRIIQIGIIILLYFFVVGNERVFGKFLYSYTVDSHLKMSPNKAYILNSIYWVCFCGSRLLTSLILYKFSVRKTYFAQIVFTMSTALVLNMFPDSLLIYVTFSAVYGLAKSPLFPTGLGVINEFLEVTGIITAVLNIGSAIGAMSMQYLTGALIQYGGHKCFLYMVLASASGIFIMGSVMLYFGKKSDESDHSH